MRFGFALPNNFGVPDADDVVALAVQAERLGFDSVWTNHHVLNVGYVLDRLDDKPYWDALTVLTWAAASTSRVRLGTSVLVLPYLHPMGLAKQLATLDHLSAGRLIAGVGVGSLQAENEALGVEWARRGALSDEFLAVMNELWTAPEPRFSGEFYRFDEVKASPKPRQAPRPPIVVGGNRAPALRRAARWDGWHPMALPPESLESRLRRLDEELAKAGRSRAELLVQVRLDLDLWASPRTQTPKAPMHGTVDQLVEMVERYRAAGAGELVLSLNTGDCGLIADTLERFAVGVIPAARR
ncbi:MAG: TIGR03619 family F420-dependent LLM class oxidoreductase [Acidimicrobiales bacterium]